jgi:hypothetical protein
VGGNKKRLNVRISMKNNKKSVELESNSEEDDDKEISDILDLLREEEKAMQDDQDTPSPEEVEAEKKRERNEKMRENGIKILKAIGILIAIAFVGYLIHSSNQEDSLKKQKEQAEQSAREQAKEDALSTKNNLLQQYGAINFDETDFIFSEDIQKESGKSFLLEGNIYDIFQKEGKRFIVLTSGYSSDYLGTFEISDEHANFIRNPEKETSQKSDFFFIVQINNASKLSLETESDQNGVWTYIEPSASFLLKGKIIDIKKSE